MVVPYVLVPYVLSSEWVGGDQMCRGGPYPFGLNKYFVTDIIEAKGV